MKYIITIVITGIIMYCLLSFVLPQYIQEDNDNLTMVIHGTFPECNQTERLPVGTEYYCSTNNISYWCKVSEQPDPHIAGYAFCEEVHFV